MEVMFSLTCIFLIMCAIVRIICGVVWLCKQIAGSMESMVENIVHDINMDK